MNILLLLGGQALPRTPRSRLLRLLLHSHRQAGATRFASTSAPKNLYSVLGVQKGASASEIKNSFYELSKKYHPDVVGTDSTSANKFLEVKEAYDVLKDEEKRRQYDEQLRSGHTYDPTAAAGGFTSAQQQAYWDHIRRRPPSSNTRRYSEEELRRIWQYMNSNKQYRDSNAAFEEWLGRARAKMYDDFTRRRAERWREDEQAYQRGGDANIPRAPFGGTFNRKTRDIINKVVGLYVFFLLIMMIFRHSKEDPTIPRNNPSFARQAERYEERDPRIRRYSPEERRAARERIREMINRPPMSAHPSSGGSEDGGGGGGW